LVTFDISSNDLDTGGTKLLAEALEGNEVMTELNISGNSMTRTGYSLDDMSGVAILADVVSGMGALMSLNLSSNNLNAEGGKIVAEAIKVTNHAMAVVLVPFSCPFDHWLNCCCLLLSPGYEGTIVAEFGEQQPWGACASYRLDRGMDAREIQAY
jgi:hypothetical protein